MRVNTLSTSLGKTLRGDRRPPGVCTSFRRDAEYNGDNIAKIDFSCNIRASLPLKRGKIMSALSPFSSTSRLSFRYK